MFTEKEGVHEEWENVHKVHAYLSAKRYMRYGCGPPNLQWVT